MLEGRSHFQGLYAPSRSLGAQKSLRAAAQFLQKTFYTIFVDKTAGVTGN